MLLKTLIANISLLFITRLCFSPRLRFIFLILMSALHSVSYAAQLSFHSSQSSQTTEFEYQWEHKNNQYHLVFEINNKALYEMPRSPAKYSQRVFQDNVYVRVMQAVKQIDPRVANINVRKKGTGLSFNVRSSKPNMAQKVLDQLSLVHDEAELRYWQDNFLVQYSSPTGKTGIRHDHAKYTQLSRLSLQPIVIAIKAMQQQPTNPREFIEIALSWIQSIPYNRLEDRLSSNGAGFIAPRDLLIKNHGDCDSKSTLMAALLQAYSTNIDVQMIYLPNHALLGVKMNAAQNELSISLKGNEYVLIEPTGPAQLAIGDVAESTRLSLRNRQFDMISL